MSSGRVTVVVEIMAWDIVAAVEGYDSGEEEGVAPDHDANLSGEKREVLELTCWRTHRSFITGC